MAARIASLRSYLAVCGINDTGPVAGRQTTELITTQGFASIDDFNGLTQSDIGKLVKAFNTNAATTGTIGFMAQKKLEALAYWVTNQTMRNIPLAIADWNAGALQQARTDSDIAAERKANPQAPKRPGKIATGLDWYTWIEQFTNYLGAIRGVNDVPLTYVIRKDMPAGWDPVADAATPEETLIYQVALTGAAFEADNRTVFTKIMEVTIGETSYEWIKQFEQTKDGRGAMAVLRRHCEGTDFQQLRVTEADRIIREATYTNERHFPFESYATLLQKAYTTYEQSGQVYPDRAKVKRLVDKMNVANNFTISHAKAAVIDNHSDNWIQAVNYLKTKVAEAFPGANRPNNRNDRRYVSETNSGRGRGRGRGGRFGRGGGRFGGRGRGRGGRDGGRGRGRGSFDDDAAIPKSIYGIDTSNIFRNFSDEEWATLGPEWQRKLRERRDAAKAREDDRYGGPRNRSAYAAYSWHRDQDGTAKKATPETPTSDGEEVKTDKGGTAGSNFGRGAYKQTGSK